MICEIVGFKKKKIEKENDNWKWIDITHVAYRYKNWELLSVYFIKRNEDKTAVMRFQFIPK